MNRADLIDRLEKLTGPCRETDAWIETEVRRLSAYAAGLNDEQRARWVIIGFKGEVDDGSVRYHSPEYTASIDAAVALVERCLPGWKRSIFEGHNGLWIARVTSPRRELFSTDYMRERDPGGSPNGAIAILIALFRALEAEGARDGN